jgi:hypothetical protein
MPQHFRVTPIALPRVAVLRSGSRKDCFLCVPSVHKLLCMHVLVDVMLNHVERW